MLLGCAHQASIGKAMLVGGGVVIGVGVIAYATSTGSDCSHGSGSDGAPETACGGADHDHHDEAAGLIGVGALIAALGVLEWAMSRPRRDPPRRATGIVAPVRYEPAPPVGEDPAMQRFIEERSPTQPAAAQDAGVEAVPQ
jgi:hypothetical protein